jgi:hypothetical protein
VAVLSIARRNYENASRELDAAAKALGVPLLPITVADVSELATGFAEMTRHHCRALVVMSDPLFVYARQQLIELTAQHHIAASYDNRLIADAGGLSRTAPIRSRWSGGPLGTWIRSSKAKNPPICRLSSRPSSSWSST